jgi:transcriptional regulator with GAF, ATPase, and Fis domain
VLDAQDLYEKAVRSAHTQGFVHNEAIANERAGCFYAARGFEKIAATYLRDARYCYRRWGADAKVRQLEQLYPQIGVEESIADATATIQTPVEHLDLATVIRVSEAVSGEIVFERLIDALMRAAIEHAGAERGLLILPRADDYQIEAEATTSTDDVNVVLRQTRITAADLPSSILHYVLRTKESVLLHDASAQNPFAADEYIRGHSVRSVLCLPLLKQTRLVGLLYLENSLTPHAFTPARMAILRLLASEAATSLENTRLLSEQKQANAEIRALKDQLYRENLALRDEVDRVLMFEEIVGSSKALKTSLSRIAKVAPTDSTVFITGETGTGKELIARAVHKRSRRSRRAFVSVNCAALAPTLISSELFGHERGAFTGATQRRLGRFELADGGTIFLDEVGELLPETQVALLRVLQEREFERVGGTQPIRIDVRVIAATNRDLGAAVANGNFRQDLFYRLNVFPIEVPPLRERQDDILMLVEYFVHRYATRAGKTIRSIDKKTLDFLQAYDWPGNIRELQNVIERSVILSSSEVFAVDESWLPKQSVRTPPRAAALAPALSALRGERETIEAALAECRARIGGPSGAAAKLGVPPSTLNHRIKALNIEKARFKFR